MLYVTVEAQSSLFALGIFIILACVNLPRLGLGFHLLLLSSMCSSVLWPFFLQPKQTEQ
jgi:hypothetical protein